MDPKQRMIRRDFDLNFESGTLRAYTKTIDGKEVKFLGGTASSTAKDLYGDVIGPEGQVKMLQKLMAFAEKLKDANSGLTGFLNHSYKIPEDTLGAFTSASLSTRVGDGITDEKGVEYIDLDIECRVTETNPRAVQAWEQVNDGIHHGWSIGCIFTEVEWMSDDPQSPDYWSLYVTDLNLLEISLVGIPANQRAWCKTGDDLKDAAVKKAEEIVREAHAQKSMRALARDEAQRRGVVLKSLVHLDGDVATTTSTSPLAARSAEQTQLDLGTGESGASAEATGEPVVTQNGAATDESASTLSVERPDGNIPGLLAANEILCKAFGVTLAAVVDGDKWVSTEIRSAHLDGENIVVGDVIKSAEEVPSAKTLTLAIPEGVDAEALAAEWKSLLEASPATFVRSAADDGSAKGIVVTLGEPPAEARSCGEACNCAEDCACRTLSIEDARKTLGVDEAQATELAQQLNARAGDSNVVFGEESKTLMQQAAGAIEVLSAALKAQGALIKRDPDDGDGPDQEPIALAIAHIAKSIGHGVCVRSANHLSEALKSLSAAVGNVVDQPEPNGGDQQSDLSAQVQKLEPKAGDVIVIKANSPEHAQQLAASGDAIRSMLPEGVTVLFADETTAASIDNDLATKAQTLEQKQQELSTTETTLTEKQTELSEIEQRTATAKSELADIEAKVEEAKSTRLGRKSANAIDFEQRMVERSGSDAEVKPEHYQKNAVAQRGALEKQMSGDGKPPTTGRDIVAAS